MHTFLDHFHLDGKYSVQVASHQAGLRREGNVTDQKMYIFHPYRLTT